MTGATHPLPRAFFERPVHQVARQLIGCHLVRKHRGTLLVGRIVETEAYAGALDPSSHSYRGPTDRCRTMFGPRGRAYVYFTYGNHHCMNVVAGSGELASAVLIRTLEPIEGLPAMRRLRAAACSSAKRAAEITAGRQDSELCNGPGKLSAALGIDRRLDGENVTARGMIWLAHGTPARRVAWTPRIGLGSNPAAPWLWRCVDADSGGVTRVPRHWPRATRATPSLRMVQPSRQQS